jgi:aldos-2-ulose dehydratase/isomerase family protein/VCBS repeat protein
MKATVLALPLVIAMAFSSTQPAAPAFRAQELVTDFGVGYAVQVADMNGDARPDVLAISGTQLVWFENPTWQKHVALDEGKTPKDNVCLAPHDIDRDGRMDVALGATWQPRNTTGGGTLHWTGRSADPAGEWTVTNILEEPTLHRIAWGDVDGDKAAELIVTPLQGRGTAAPDWNGNGVRILMLRVPKDPRRDQWPVEVVDESLHILHNLLIANFDVDPASEILTASREGVHLFDRDGGKWTKRLIGEGAPGEIKMGRIGRRRVLASIEPWHGNGVVLYLEPPLPSAAGALWERRVIEDKLTEGHAVGWGDFDGDGDDELAVGWRVKPFGLAIYDVDRDGKLIAKHTIDADGMATEDLAVADLNADKRPDIVASGRLTRNVKIYWNERK